MALTCSSCGTANPDGNAFCHRCGSALSAVAPPPVPPVTPPPPVASPPAVVSAAAPPPPPPSPYWAPPPAAALPQAHRLGSGVVVGIAVAVVALVIGVGAIVVMASGHGGQQPVGRQTPGPVPVTSAPTPAPSTPRPTSAPTHRPTPAPTSSGAPRPGGKVVDTAQLTVPVPAGFTVLKQEAGTVELSADDKSGIFSVNSGAFQGTVSDLKQALLQSAGQTLPDAAFCGKDGQVAMNGSIPAQLFSICGTLTLQSGQALKVQDIFAIAVVQSGGQNVALEWDAFFPDDTGKQFVDELGSTPDNVVFKAAG
jgi:hypothetical protein